MINMSEKALYQVSLKLILKNNQGQILGVKALDNGSYAGFYDLPGGRIDVGEFKVDFLDILKREIKEELGDVVVELKPKPVALSRFLLKAKFSSSNIDKHILYVFFEGKYLGGNVTISDEHTAFKWLDFNQEIIKQYFIFGILDGLKMYLA